jgi:metal-responsive CopG/Arc/MetJ family transcriptional regulator
MKVKTSITLSEQLLKEIDNMVEEYGNRSKIIEEALREFISHKHRQFRDIRDLELINSNVDVLNKEANDSLGYQVKI